MSDENHRDVTARENIDGIINKFIQLQASPERMSVFLRQQTMLGAINKEGDYE